MNTNLLLLGAVVCTVLGMMSSSLLTSWIGGVFVGVLCCKLVEPPEELTNKHK
jgi:ABC-type uncharacterized transport system permease subunit